MSKKWYLSGKAVCRDTTTKLTKSAIINVKAILFHHKIQQSEPLKVLFGN